MAATVTDYLGRTFIKVLACLCAIALCLLLALASCEGGTNTGGRLERFKNDLLINTNVLASYITALLEGRVEKIPGEVGFSPPKNVNSTAFTLRSVTVDANTNIYFVTDQSSTFANVGFIYQTHGAALLGDGQEPTIMTNIPIVGRWHYYVSR